MRSPFYLLDLDRAPNTVLVRTKDRDHTRGELLGQAAALGNRLKAVGVAPEDTVIVCLDSGPLFVAAVAGCWFANATPVLIDPLVRKECGRAVQMTRARAIIQSRSYGTDDLGIPELNPEAGMAVPAAPLPARNQASPVLFLFTSGSTGAPTLVPKNFQQLDVEVQFLSTLFASPTYVATMAPWCHIFGLIVSLLVPARSGGICDISAGISPLGLLRLALEKNTDLVVAVPAVYQVMAKYLEGGKTPARLKNCRFVTSGAPLHPALRSRLQTLTGCEITDLYGSTEAGGVAYKNDDGPWLVQPHVQARIADDQSLEVRSPSVSMGTPDDFYRMGDLARAEGPGFVLLGRADDIVKIGGRRTSLGEITEALESHPGVAGAAVLAQKIRGALRLVAFVEPHAPDLSEASIRAFLKERLADHKVPAIVHMIVHMPRTPAGKIDRQRLSAAMSGEC
ncbi:MAG: class I adenylate-forming enzyme family protein [Myxococcota bacterium]|nr:class I adenylate-forming enzyme family protein [Myxococcota bacterium]